MVASCQCHAVTSGHWLILLLLFLPLLYEQEEVFLYGEEISVDATEKEDEVRFLFPNFFDTHVVCIHPNILLLFTTRVVLCCAVRGFA